MSMKKMFLFLMGVYISLSVSMAQAQTQLDVRELCDAAQEIEDAPHGGSMLPAGLGDVLSEEAAEGALQVVAYEGEMYANEILGIDTRDLDARVMGEAMYQLLDHFLWELKALPDYLNTILPSSHASSLSYIASQAEINYQCERMRACSDLFYKLGYRKLMETCNRYEGVVRSAVDFHNAWMQPERDIDAIAQAFHDLIIAENSLSQCVQLWNRTAMEERPFSIERFFYEARFYGAWLKKAPLSFVSLTDLSDAVSAKGALLSSLF